MYKLIAVYSSVCWYMLIHLYVHAAGTVVPQSKTGNPLNRFNWMPVASRHVDVRLTLAGKDR